MKVQGSGKPLRFTTEPIPGRPRFLLVRFRENAQPFEETLGEQTVSGWEYDEYTLELYDSGMAAEDIEADYDALLARAKADEEARTGPSVEDDLLEMTLDQEVRIAMLEMEVE